MRRTVAIVRGGGSSEHEISLASAQSVIAALDPDRYEVVAIEIGRDGRWELSAGTPDGQPTLPPGQLGRDTTPVPGTVPGTGATGDAARPDLVERCHAGLSLTSTSSCRSCTARSARTGSSRACLEMAGIPYVGAGVEGSSMCMDKDVTKRILRGSDISQ